MKITYTVPEQAEPKTGHIIHTYQPGKYIVKEDRPTLGQPKERFVFSWQVVKIGD